MTSAIDQLLRVDGKYRRVRNWTRMCQGGVMAYAILQILVITALCLNHWRFPLPLDGLELARLDHVQQLLAGHGLYGPPTADRIALVTTPLYYYLCAPIVGLLGPNLSSLRLVSLLGLGLCGLLLFMTLRRKLASPWWAAIGLGLFAASYASLDGSLDSAHPDSWLLAMLLLGAWWIDLGHCRRRNALGILCFVLAVWLKQHGALFLGAALVYVTWRQGWRRAWEAWLLAAATALVYGLGPLIFGPSFHDATWWQPRSWVDFEPETLLRLVGFTARYYPILAIAAIAAVALSLLQSHRPPSIWSFLFPAAVVSGFVGALDRDSLNNVFAPLALWYIMAGLVGLRLLSQRLAYKRRWQLRLLSLGLSFGLLIYSPMGLAVSGQAQMAYDDLLATLEALPNPVYVPALGPLPIEQISPLVPAEAIEGVVRSWPMPPDRNPFLTALLGPALDRPGSYLLLMGDSASPPVPIGAPIPRLQQDRILSPWGDRYRLDIDFGDRFIALKTPRRPGRPRWPRYLLRQSPSPQPAAPRLGPAWLDPIGDNGIPVPPIDQAP